MLSIHQQPYPPGNSYLRGLRSSMMKDLFHILPNTPKYGLRYYELSNLSKNQGLLFTVHGFGAIGCEEGQHQEDEGRQDSRK